jgi:hypothetical protein
MEEEEEEEEMAHAYTHTLNPHQRLVVFCGPHISEILESLLVRQFFVKHANNGNSEKLPAFENWTWPFYPRAKHPDAFSELVIYHPSESASANDDRKRELWSTILAVWGHRRIHNHNHNHNYNYNHMILGTEEFDRLPPTPFTQRNGLAALERLIELTQPPELQLIVLYQTPRSVQWMNILWKQSDIHTHTHHRTTSYRELLCDSYTTMQTTNDGSTHRNNMVWELASTAANPLRMVHEFRQHGWNVSLMDLGGIMTRDGLDASHTISCEVLHVPCTNGWVDGLKRPTTPLRDTKNTTRRLLLDEDDNDNANDMDMNMNIDDDSLGLSRHQLDQLEWLFRQRDCYYQFLQHDPGVMVHHADSIWKNCPRYATPFSTNLAQNTTLFVSLLQAIVGGCGGDGMSTEQKEEQLEAMLLLQHQEDYSTPTYSALELMLFIVAAIVVWRYRLSHPSFRTKVS